MVKNSSQERRRIGDRLRAYAHKILDYAGQAGEEAREHLTGENAHGKETDEYHVGAEAHHIFSGAKRALATSIEYALEPESRERIRAELGEKWEYAKTPAGRYEAAANALRFAGNAFNFADNFVAAATAKYIVARSGGDELAATNLIAKLVSEFVATPLVTGTFLHFSRNCREKAAELRGEPSSEKEKHQSGFQQWVDSALAVGFIDAAVGAAGSVAAYPIETAALETGADPSTVLFLSTAAQSGIMTYLASQGEEHQIVEHIRQYVRERLPRRIVSDTAETIVQGIPYYIGAKSSNNPAGYAVLRQAHLVP
ncbi:MAG: hypothetical protein V1820_00885 [archaeon]